MSRGARDTRFPSKRSLAGAVSLAALCCSTTAFASSCEDLAGRKLPDTTIETAQTVPTGDYATSDKITRKAMPAFCRVLASVKGAPDQDIQIEVWLPKDQWKGVFHGLETEATRASYPLATTAWKLALNAAMRPRRPIWGPRRRTL
jgi:feruloyl esterase